MWKTFYERGQEPNRLLAGKGKGGTDQNLSFSIRTKKFPTQGRGNSIGIPKSLHVYHFRCFPCLFHSPLEFVNPTPPPIKLKIACVLERPCPWMNLHSFLKNARKLLQVACVCLSERTSKQSGPLPFEGVGGMGDFKLKIYPANWFQGGKILAGNTWPKKFWKIKQPLGTGPGGF